MDFSPYRKYSDTFIETGTYIGESIAAALKAGFTKVKSVESYLQSHQYSTKRFYQNENVELFFGRSVDLLPEMIKDIPIPSVFWLDAHPSGPGTSGHEGWLKGDKEVFQDTILTKEIDIILAHGKHILLIDDQHGWETAYLFKEQIEKLFPYSFEILDEERPDITYKEKVLLCKPVL